MARIVWAAVWAVVITWEIVAVELNPQHGQFLKVMFWEFPRALVKAWIPF